MIGSPKDEAGKRLKGRERRESLRPSGRMLASQQQRQGDGGKRRYTYEDVLGSTKKWKPLVSCGASSDASASVSRYVAATVATPPAGESAQQRRGNGVEDGVAQAYELCLAKPKVRSLVLSTLSTSTFRALRKEHFLLTT